MIHQKLETLDHILGSEYPIDENYFNSLLEELYAFKEDQDFKSGMSKLREKHEIIRTNCTMQGRGFSKDYGYAGDFEIIDKIYTNFKSENNICKKWDVYFQKQPAPIAVRNRKTYFINKLSQLTAGRELNILNLASGPCRDILELFQKNPNCKARFDCVELDKNAIQYAKTLLGDFNEHVHFINKNIFRFTPTKQYDLIWSAGLFDYFDDKTFTRILGRMIESNPKAKIIIGNFADTNPTMPYMEIIGEWFLNHRGEEKLKTLAIDAGADPKSITIESEDEKVNLFLNIN